MPSLKKSLFIINLTIVECKYISVVAGTFSICDDFNYYSENDRLDFQLWNERANFRLKKNYSENDRLDFQSVFSVWNMKRRNLLHIKFRVSRYKKYITLQNTNLFQKTCLSISRKILYITYRHTRILYKIWSFVNIFFYQKRL